MITLGAEVAAVLRRNSSISGATNVLLPQIAMLRFGEVEVPTIHCAHPGILMRPGPGNPWPNRHREEFLPIIKRFLDQERMLVSA